jgi:hypothetical protein
MLAPPMTLLIYLPIVGLILSPALYAINGLRRRWRDDCHRLPDRDPASPHE